MIGDDWSRMPSARPIDSTFQAHDPR